MKPILLAGSLLFLSIGLKARSETITPIDPVLWQQAQQGKSLEIIVVLKEQTDVSGAYLLRNKEEKGQYVFEHLNETADRTQGSLIQYLQQLGLSYQRFWVVNAVLVKGAGTALLTQLAQREEVKELVENAHYTYHHPLKESATVQKTDAVEWGISKTQADAVWALGYKGQGVVVGGQDTGYEWDHPALKNKYRGFSNGTVNHNYNWHDAIHSGNTTPCGFDSNQPCDDDTHGTHTMGTMVGDDGAGNQTGMAPNAKWIGCRNMNQGVGTLASYTECFQWFIAPTDLSNNNPNPAKAPHVINNSWSCDGSEGCNSSNFATMEIVVNNVRAAGIVVVVSAGNDGSNCSTITTPAAIYAASFTVGSTKNTDEISSFSSRGPVTVYGTSMMGPDVSAPGSGVRSSVPGGGYQSMSGTSMAGPHVVGLVALIISANPALAGNVDAIENIIKNTAVQLTSTQSCGNVSGSTIPNNTFGYGRINALAAIQEALNVSVNNPENQPPGVNVYPNPFNREVGVELKHWGTSTCTIELYAITGQLVYAETWIPQFKTRHELNVKQIEPGLYFYKLYNEKNLAQGRIIKAGN